MESTVWPRQQQAKHLFQLPLQQQHPMYLDNNSSSRPDQSKQVMATVSKATEIKSREMESMVGVPLKAADNATLFAVATATHHFLILL
ncbi:Hypothetical protein NTJ_14629 [Nesidiocoris tenuis]|uniref:Uncharacterized protein n=1 Tax=Nesidiocoris tenuis TaxID=355587 RepID=A0ABN7BBW7_9HEMI|nr:Hypothetical protein NTJ_14629 [Nesidiocoris tenuis]